MPPCIRGASLEGFVALARSVGLDPTRQIARAGLSVGALATPSQWIPASAAAWLLESSAVDSGCEDFGLRLSSWRRLAILGPLSVVLREEPDLRSALRLLVRYEYSYNEAISLQLDEADGLATVRLWLDLGEPAPTRQCLELAVASLLHVIRRLVQSDWQAQRVCFTHSAPGRLTTHQRLLGPRIQFECDFTGLVFRAAELVDQNVLADPLLLPYRPQLLRAVPPPRARTVVDQVRELVEALLPLGRCSMRTVARGLNLTTRTLRRHLHDEHETFSSIEDAVRATMAERYLANDRLSLTDVSGQLGFAAPSAFSRWFRNRFGVSPTAWRQASRGLLHDAGTAAPSTGGLPRSSVPSEAPRASAEHPRKPT